MGLQQTWGIVVFFAVPLILWLIGAIAARRLGRDHALLVVISGTDGRLSVSRLQALLWTLVIFGAYAAAMAVSDSVSVDKWIKIPGPVLQLAAISLASGVFSSLIASQKRDGKTSSFMSGPNVSVGPIPHDGGQQGSATAGATGNLSEMLVILSTNGADFGSKVGRVRLGKERLGISKWANNEITAVIPRGSTAPSELQKAMDDYAAAAAKGEAHKVVTEQMLFIDTENGKVCFPLFGSLDHPMVGVPTKCYEFADLFRDDSSPDSFDLLKFQMFGWTVVAIAVYVVLFLSNLNDIKDSLPTVDSTIALLTGISQTGYLAGKAIP
jgi:hypothetical protein